jgi:hypothetical protein
MLPFCLNNYVQGGFLTLFISTTTCTSSKTCNFQRDTIKIGLLVPCNLTQIMTATITFTVHAQSLLTHDTLLPMDNLYLATSHQNDDSNHHIHSAATAQPLLTHATLLSQQGR